MINKVTHSVKKDKMDQFSVQVLFIYENIYSDR